LKLLAAAEKIFGEHGYERASIVDITREAGVAQGTFYVYFPSKQAVFTELVNELGSRLRRSLAEATSKLEGRLEMERAGLYAFLEFVREHRNLYRIVRQAEFVDEALYRGYYLKMAEGYRKGLRAAMDDGEFKKFDAEAIAYSLMGIFDFLGMRWVLWEGKLPPPRVLDDVFEFITSGLGRTSAPAGASTGGTEAVKTKTRPTRQRAAKPKPKPKSGR
jgi:AcrR family transcriptional regulator